MYTTIATILLASTGLAPSAQGQYSANGYGTFGAYGCGNNYGGYGDYGRTPPNSTCGEYCGSPYFVPGYPYYGAGPSYQVDAGGRREDLAIKDLKKQVADIVSILPPYINRLKDFEQKLEQQAGQAELLKQIAQSNKEMQEKLTEALAKINDGNEKKLADLLANFERKVNDAVAAKLEALKTIQPVVAAPENVKSDVYEKRIAELESKLRSIDSRDSNKQEAIAQANAEILHKMVLVLDSMSKSNANNNIIQLLEQIRSLQNQQPPPPISQPIRGGHPVTRCLLIVHLPADAELYLDGHPSKVGSNLRTFISPDLEHNKNYFYNLKVELKRGDKVFTEHQKVYFQPGREYEINFDYLESVIANQLRSEKKD